jgi:hypothetical protein
LGVYYILINDFELGSTISTWFSQPGWEWRLPVAQNPQWSCQKQKIHRTWSRRQRRRPRKAAQAKQAGENDSDEILTDHRLSSGACSS